MAQRNLYEVLGVPRTAPEADIRKAYRKLARENHPDRNPGDTAAENRFKEASYAKEILLNQKKRALYDEFGEIGLREGFDPEAFRRYNAARSRQGGFPGGSAGDVNLEDLIEQMRRQGAAGGGGGASGPGGWSGSFQDFINGDVVDSIFGRAPRRAKKDLVSEIQVGFLEAIKGTEKEISFRAPGGKDRVLRARIPAGVADGGRVRLRGQGADGGDLVLTVHVAPHPHFERDGSDLMLTLPITVGEAFNGAKVPIPTPEGEVQLTIPAGVQSGAKLRLRGRGVKRGDSLGDLIVTLQVRLPDRSNGEAAKLVEALEGTYDQSPRADLRL